MKTFKRFISTILCLVLMCSVIPLIETKTEAAYGFAPRTTIPETSNAYYYNYSYNPFYTSGLWTWCTWYAYGRAYEILGYKPDLSIRAASQWYYDNITKVNNGGGYAYSSNYYAAKLGAVACYENHVQIVEAVNSDGSPLYLSTGGFDKQYGGTPFNNKDGWTQHTNFFYGHDTTKGFLGYIYLGDFSPFANIGEDFYATFLNKAAWKPISVKRGNGVTIETEDGKSTQKWRFTRQSDGAYVIRSCYNGKCLEMTDGIRENCVQVTAQNDFWGGNYQQWYIIPYGSDNSYIIQNKHYYDENWVLDLYGADSSDGNVVEIYQRNNSDAQIWSIYSADDVQLKPTTLTATVNSPDVTFTWNEVSGESSYDVKIWKGEAWDGDPYKVIWNTESGCTVELPAGSYSAYVDACDYFQCFMSNVVTFTVEESEKVSGYYTYEIDENGNATIIRCDPSISGDITVPQTLDGYPVTKIGSNAFKGCKNITEITILENIISAYHGAFEGCVSLKRANIMADGNNSVLGSSVFCDCSNLETVYLHNANVKYDTAILTSFWGCKSLKRIEFSEDNPYLKSINGVVYSKDGSILWYVPRGIADEEFYVPETVTEIASGALSDCQNIKDIYIYGSETVISTKYYDNIGYITSENYNGWISKRLDYVTIHAKSDSYAKEYADINGINFVELTDKPTIDLSLFTYEISNGEVILLSCNSEAKGEIIIPSEIEGSPVTVIGDNCFYNCSEISNLVIPDTVTTIGSYAFGCEYDYDSENTFETVFIPASVTSIGYNAFYECDSLKEIIVSEDNLYYSSDEYGVLFNKDKTELIRYPKDCEQKNYEIPNTVQRLSACAFQGADVEYISIPESVSEIATDSFFTALKGISVDSDNAYFSSDEYGVLFNKDKTKLIRYPALSSRTSYKVPESVTELEICAFDDAENLVSVELSDNIREIGYCTFDDCVNLKNITLPEKLKVIGEMAFQECTSLESFIVPYGVETIGYYAFRWSENIKYVHITEDTTSIGEAILDEIEGDVYICSDSEDCYAREYAEQYGYEFRVCDNHGLVDPDAPDEPDVPNAPDEPDAPNVPDEPDVPNVPDEPDAPNVPDEPDAPNVPDEPDAPDVPNTPVYIPDLILAPSQTAIRYGDSIILHADVSEIPQGGYVVWEASNGNFDMSVSADGSTCTITPKSSGDTTFTAKVVSSDGEVLAEDTQTMTSKAGLWDKIVAFFKKIFGLTKTIPQIYRGVF